MMLCSVAAPILLRFAENAVAETRVDVAPPFSFTTGLACIRRHLAVGLASRRSVPYTRAHDWHTYSYVTFSDMYLHVGFTPPREVLLAVVLAAVVRRVGRTRKPFAQLSHGGNIEVAARVAALHCDAQMLGIVQMVGE